MKKIDSEAMYSVREIARNRFLRLQDYRSVISLIEEGSLKAFIKGKGSGKRYLVKGSEIIKLRREMGW